MSLNIFNKQTPKKLASRVSNVCTKQLQTDKAVFVSHEPIKVRFDIKFHGKNDDTGQKNELAFVVCPAVLQFRGPSFASYAGNGSLCFLLFW